MKTVRDFAQARREGRPIVMVTAYDALMARCVAAAGVDCILVGDSAAMVVHGFPSTVEATVEMMALHTAAVRRGAPDTLVITDLPFGTFRRGRHQAAEVAATLIRAGANAVKLEGVAGHAEVITHLVEGGIPVMGHLGLTPQSVNLLGGYRVQGRSAEAAAKLREDARVLEARGAFGLVLECVPAALAKTVTEERKLPTIGIGAGPHTSGQVLVLTDLLGWDERFTPSFARKYLDGHALALAAVGRFCDDVRAANFPGVAEVPA